MAARPDRSTPAFMYMTHDGEVILLDELVREVHAGLGERGVDIDQRPLKAMLQAVRTVTEHIAAHRGRPPGLDAVCDLLVLELRGERMIVGKPVLRSVLEEYLRQLQRLDIARVAYY